MPDKPHSAPAFLPQATMVERVFALHRSDLHHACQLAERLAQPATPIVTVIDPALLTYAHGIGLSQVRLLPVPEVDIACAVHAQALAATRALCERIDGLLAETWPAARGAAWCGHWLYHLHFIALGFRRLAPALAPRLAGVGCHVLMPQLPHRFGYHAFVAGLQFSEGLRQAGVAVQCYGTELPAWDAPLLPDPLGPCQAAATEAVADAGAVARLPDDDVPELLCHLPTCFYDDARYAAEIQASGRSAAVLPAQHFDVPLPGLPRWPLVPPETLARKLPAERARSLAALAERLHALLCEALTPLIEPPRLRESQAGALTAALQHQALLLMALEQRFAAARPRMLLLSNHDALCHGALLTWARTHGITIRMLPHAKLFPDPVPSYGHDLQCLTHPLQGGEVIDLDGARLSSAPLDFGDGWQFAARPAQPLATLGIVLNAVSTNAVCQVDVTRYLDGLLRIKRWAEEQGVRLRLRCRPNASMLSLLVQALQMDMELLIEGQQGSMLDFAAGCDLVLGYDIPTSGALELLQQGIPMLQVLVRPLGPQEWRMLHPEVVPQLGLDAALARLQAFRDDGLALWRHRRGQLAGLVARGARALPLRAWLGEAEPA